MEELMPVLQGIMYVILAFAIFAIGKFLYDRFADYTLDEQLTSADNLAVALAIGGYYVGLIIVISAILMPSAAGAGDAVEIDMPVTVWNLILFLSYGAFGLAALLVSQKLNDRLILRRMAVAEELVRDHNKGVGVVIMAANLASAIFIGTVASGGVIFDLGWIVESMSMPAYLAEYVVGLIASVLVFAAGQLGLFIFVFFSEKALTYDVQYELEEKDNIAAGLSFAGCILAIGILIAKIIKLLGGVIDLQTAYLLIFIFLMLFCLGPIVRLFVDKILLPGAHLSKEITEDQNSGAGLIEALVQIGFAAIIFFGM